MNIDLALYVELLQQEIRRLRANRDLQELKDERKGAVARMLHVSSSEVDKVAQEYTPLKNIVSKGSDDEGV